MVPQFDQTTGHLPPGRFRTTLEEARQLLVFDSRFAGSSTRRRLWNGLERYLARFGLLEQEYRQHMTADPLLHYIWMGGSFASAEVDPSNIDLTVCYDAVNRDALRGRPRGGWMNEAFKRETIRDEYGVSPLALPYRRVKSPFLPKALPESEQGYLMFRGGWDDWWQRCRTVDGASEAPSSATAHAQRGYLEVTL